MILVNGKEMEWNRSLGFSDNLKALGYTIPSHRVIIRVIGRVKKLNPRHDYKIPDEAEIEIINTLCSG